MENKERRKVIRVPLIKESCKWKLMDGVDVVESEMADFAKTGCFIKSAKPLAVGSYLNIHMNLPGNLGAVKIEGIVVWTRWAKRKNDLNDLGFGVKFIDVADHIDRILDAYQTYLRNRQIIAVSKRIVEEFFDKVPPKL